MLSILVRDFISNHLISLGILENKPKMALSKLKVCLIGAGPSGMSVMFHLNRLAQQGVQVPELKCYEKQSNWGGLWNYSWRTGMKSNNLLIFTE